MAGGCGGAGRPVGYKNTPRPNEAYARISAKKNAPTRAAGFKPNGKRFNQYAFIMRKSVAHPFISFGLYWFYCKLSLAACQAWGSFVTLIHSLPGVNAASSSQVSSIALLALLVLLLRLVLLASCCAAGCGALTAAGHAPRARPRSTPPQPQTAIASDRAAASAPARLTRWNRLQSC